jgi:hypothetical protein
MKKRGEHFSETRVYMMSHLGHRKLTSEAIENYLAEGRRLHSVFMCDFFINLGRTIGVVFGQTARWIGSIINGRRTALADRFRGKAGRI